ncbi:hypothetical protein BEN47_15630 [Hymenobacter lapidarius]|uniref:Plasmid recombination enzyme n=2 Tax=Hymenobacter lapidarius TaxID=1908237 RepID=A0A1G1T299_9BACT|nr:hypothetical protein BEN47_15630 [Hymenobacter lapidarius]
MSDTNTEPPRAIGRINKVSKQGEAEGKFKHNYRLMNTPNADAERTGRLNQELINTDHRDYWTLANERIDEGIAKTARGKPRKVRDDQVRFVEFLLTASPEWFKRDEKGQAEDMRGSKWVTDNLDFLKNKYGEKNVVSFTLHQDEKTPHIHAVVVPLTSKGHLSADTLFNPITLKQLQTDYAKAMASHGLVRGVEGSRRQHLDMKQIYGRQDKTAAELSSELGKPVATQAAREIVLDKVPTLGYKSDEWRDKEQARINADLVRQVLEANERTEQANKRAQEAIQYAIANAGAQEQVEVLRRQLTISEGIKQGNFDQTRAERAQLDELAMRLAAGEETPKSILERGRAALDRAFEEVEQGRKNIDHLKEKADQADKKGEYERIAELRAPEKGLIAIAAKRQNELEANFRGFPGGAERLDKLDEQQAQEREDQNKKLADQAEKDKQDREQKLADQAKRELMRKLIAEDDKRLKDEQEARRVAQHELSVMDKAISHWKIYPGDLTACLIVPEGKAEAVEKALTIPGSSYASPMLVQGEPHRSDGLKAVYVHYEANFASKIGVHFSRIREIGGEVYEHTGMQARREQLQAQPQQKIQEREQEPTKSKGFNIGG